MVVTEANAIVGKYIDGSNPHQRSKAHGGAHIICKNEERIIEAVLKCIG